MSTILTADIGGTNCRFGAFTLEAGQLALKRRVWASTGDIPHLAAFLEALEEALEIGPHEADALVVAVAGPTDGQFRGSLTNASLALDFSDYVAKNRKARVRVINDFIAQAYAIPTRCGSGARLVAGPAHAPELARKGILGAGTGLGEASLVWAENSGVGAGGRWLGLPSENGHSPFPFMDAEEQAFHEFLRQKLGVPYASGDDLLTGRGLRCLHFYLTGKELEPARVGAEALGSETETLVWYSRFYARACRCWMLSSLCGGGLWISGGIAAKNPYCVSNEHFLKELYNAPRWKDFLEAIPARLMEDKDSGLWGAAQVGKILLAER